MKKKTYRTVIITVLIGLIVLTSLMFYFGVQKKETKSEQALSSKQIKGSYNNLSDNVFYQTKLGERDATPKINRELQTINDSVSKSRFYGAYLVVKDNKIIFSNKNGYADASTRTLFKLDSTFSVGNYQSFLNKAMIYKLLSDHKLAKNEKLEKYIPEIGTKNKLTVASLLEGHDKFYIDGNVLSEIRNDSYSSIKKIKLESKRSKNAHVAHSALEAALICRVLGKNYKQVIKMMLIQPMGLQNTLIDENDKSTQANLVTGYQYSENAGNPVQVKKSVPSGGAFGNEQMRMSLADIVLSYLDIMKENYFSASYKSSFLKATDGIQNVQSDKSLKLTTEISNQFVLIDYKKKENLMVLVASNFPNKNLSNQKLEQQIIRILS